MTCTPFMQLAISLLFVLYNVNYLLYTGVVYQVFVYIIMFIVHFVCDLSCYVTFRSCIIVKY